MPDFKEIQNAPMEKLKGVKLNLALSRRIVNQPGLVGCNIVGTQQSGKSSYAMLVLWELYQGDVEQVFKHIVFSIKDLITLLNNAVQNHERLLCVLWDDSSVHGSAQQYNVNRKLVTYLSAMGDTMGLATKSILLTSPSGDIIKAFRNYNFYKVTIKTGRHKYDRIARGYEFGMSPFSQKWGRTAFEDNYDMRIPFYDRYYKLREELSLSTLKDMDSFISATNESDKGSEEGEITQPARAPTIKERVIELRRDIEAGILGTDITFKAACQIRKLPYDYAKHISLPSSE